MNNRLVVSGTCLEHYFHRQTGEIFTQCRTKNGLWSEPFCVTDSAKGPYSIVADISYQKHLIYVDTENRLVYAIKKNSVWKSFVLSAIHSDIKPIKMELFPISGRLHLIYSANFKDKYILVHCILGNRAKPQIIDTVSSAHFWVYNKKIYYTNLSGAVGFFCLSHDEPDTFCRICESGENISAYYYVGTEFILYTKDSRLFVNSKELVYDSRMEMPVLTYTNSKLYLMWKSGGYVRYITSKDGGETWDNPMRFMTNGTAIETFTIQKGGNLYMFYGYNSSRELHLFSKPDIFRI